MEPKEPAETGTLTVELDYHGDTPSEPLDTARFVAELVAFSIGTTTEDQAIAFARSPECRVGGRYTARVNLRDVEAMLGVAWLVFCVFNRVAKETAHRIIDEAWPTEQAAAEVMKHADAGALEFAAELVFSAVDAQNADKTAPVEVAP